MDSARVNISLSFEQILNIISQLPSVEKIKLKKYLAEEISKENSLTDQQITILKERKQKHLNGESKSYAWEDIKEELNNRYKKV